MFHVEQSRGFEEIEWAVWKERGPVDSRVFHVEHSPGGIARVADATAPGTRPHEATIHRAKTRGATDSSLRWE